MINKLKQMLLEEPENIASLLSAYGFDKISIRNNEIRFAHDSDGGANNISIRTDPEKNSYLNVADYSHGIYTDIFSYIIQERGVTFKDVLTTTKNILGLDESWQPPSKSAKLFGGVYDKIINRTPPKIKTYSDDILKNYVPIGNKLWLNDGISLEAQREFNICFDIESNSIVIPWYNQFGEIIAIKNRINGIPEDGMSKYYYSLGGLVSSSLYGFSENYIYLQNTEILIGESEKQVLQLATKGYRNAVSLGSNSLSEQQAKLLLSLNPTKLIWLLDEGLPKENTLRNAQIVQEYCAMRQVEQYWWNWENSLTVSEGTKMSPGDCSKNDFENILKYELEKLNIGDEKI